MPDYRQLLGPDGPLADALPGFRPREEQMQMAEAVGDALEHRTQLVVEAGTGTGKTFAYLVPALLSGRRVIVSTGTRTLQDQLYHRDLPMVGQALGRPVRVALLKGRANYLCRHRLSVAGAAPELAGLEAASSRKLTQIATWARSTQAGDIGELESIPDSDPVWAAVTSTRDNCLGTECPEYAGCHVVEARRDAQAADLVIVNHHLLLADMAIREEGFGELLPGADAVVLDEAHQFPDVAAQFFGTRGGSRPILALARDALLELTRAGLLDAAAHIRGHSRATDVVQLCENDPHNQLATFAERPVYISKIMVNAPPESAVETRRFSSLEDLLRRDSFDSASAAAAALNISWLLVSPGCTMAWDSGASPVLSSNGYRLYRFDAPPRH